jgi:hypothetical protein
MQLPVGRVLATDIAHWLEKDVKLAQAGNSMF